MVITGMKVYKFVALLATIVLSIALVMEALGEQRTEMVITYLLFLSSNLILYPLITRRNKQE